MRQPIILLGGGGHCRSMIDVIEMQNAFTIAGIVDLPEMLGELVMGYPVIATDNEIEELCRKYKHFAISIGDIINTKRRSDLFNVLKLLGASLPVLASPRSYLSRTAIIGDGTVIMHGAVVNSNVKVGSCCIVNTGAILEHDVLVDDYCHIGPGACINGGCKIYSDTLVGSNAVILPGLSIGRNSIVAAGAVVTRHISDNVLVAGNPAKVKRST